MNSFSFGGEYGCDLNGLFSAAKEEGVKPCVMAAMTGNIAALKNVQTWSEPKEFELSSNDTSGESLIFNPPEGLSLAGEYTDVLSEMARQSRSKMYFPLNSAFLHGLGAIATAMQLKFSYEYFSGSAPVTLFTIVAQPPSTNKSGINKVFCEPIQIAYDDLGSKTAVEFRAKKKLLKKIEKEASGAERIEEIISFEEKITKLTDEIKELSPVDYCVTDATVESLTEYALGNKGGIGNLVSDEGGGLDSMLVGYGDSAPKADILLQGWDGGYVKPIRVSRKCKAGYARICVNIVAQPPTIELMMNSGQERGNGIGERFLTLNEANLFGKIDYLKIAPIDSDVRDKYSKLVRNLVNADESVLRISKDIFEIIGRKRNMIGEHLKDGGQLSNAMIRGLAGKYDKHVYKIASCLHAAEHWVDGGSKSLTINEDTIIRAMAIFDYLIGQYTNAADQLGVMGDKTEHNDLLRVLKKSLDKGSSITISKRELRDKLKNLKSFKGRSDLTKYITDELIPSAENLEWLCQHKGVLYINPRLKI